jgi:RNA ligase (TIGR02306 family)
MENQNSVCFIAKINEVKAIEGADNIELVIAGGWNAITKKGEDDLTIIATTDAVIPETLSESMGVTSYLRKGSRVRTVKLRGVYSECLIIPTKYLSGNLTMGDYDLIEEGRDCMEFLGITKYEPPVKQIQLASGKTRKCRENLDFGVYYKFPNLKNVTGMFTEEDEVQITRKIHGTNFRAGIVRKVELSLYDRVRLFLNSKLGIGGDSWKWCGYEFYIGSHNVVKDIQSLNSSIGKGSNKSSFYSTDVWSEITERYNIKEKLWQEVKRQGSDVGQGLILYGEVYGAGIQGKGYNYGLNNTQLVVFDIKLNGGYCATEVTQVITETLLELPHVEVLYEGKWDQEIQDSYIFNNFIEGTKTPHEGIVIKHISGDRQKVAKCINPEYLIFEEKHILDTDIVYNH